MKKLVLLIMVLGLLLVSGCASIISSNQKLITFRSEPSPAKLTVWDDRGLIVFKGETPTQLTLETGEAYFHGHDYIVLFSKEGFENRTINLSSSVNGWYFGNIIFGGLIGMVIIDPLTGAMWTIYDKDLYIDFNKPIKQDSIKPDEMTKPKYQFGTDTGFGYGSELFLVYDPHFSNYYHHTGCPTTRYGTYRTKLTKEQAEALGLKPCPVCIGRKK